MITTAWIERRRQFWTRTGTLLERAGRDGLRALPYGDVRELAFLYRQLASDLSAVRQDGTARTLEYELNGLMTRAHSLLYARGRSGLRAIWVFLRYEYPRLFRRLLPYVLASLLLMLGGAVLGALLTLARPQFMTHMLGPEMVATIERHQMWTHSINSMRPQASSGIMTNNISVTFAAFAMGITAGVGTLYMIGWNGLLLGVIGTACGQHGMSLDLWSFVAPHGSLELPAIVIAGAAGLRLAAGLLFPGIYSRRYSLAAAGAEATRLIAGVVPMLVIAGSLEGFFSPSAAPVALKFVTGAVLFTGLIVWLFSARSQRKKQDRLRAGAHFVGIDREATSTRPEGTASRKSFAPA